MFNIAIVAFGGAVGSVCRYLTGLWMTGCSGRHFLGAPSR